MLPSSSLTWPSGAITSCQRPSGSYETNRTGSPARAASCWTWASPWARAARSAPALIGAATPSTITSPVPSAHSRRVTAGSSVVAVMAPSSLPRPPGGGLVLDPHVPRRHAGGPRDVLRGPVLLGRARCHRYHWSSNTTFRYRPPLDSNTSETQRRPYVVPSRPATSAAPAEHAPRSSGLTQRTGGGGPKVTTSIGWLVSTSRPSASNAQPLHGSVSSAPVRSVSATEHPLLAQPRLGVGRRCRGPAPRGAGAHRWCSRSRRPLPITCPVLTTSPTRTRGRTGGRTRTAGRAVPRPWSAARTRAAPAGGDDPAAQHRADRRSRCRRRSPARCGSGPRARSTGRTER